MFVSYTEKALQELNLKRLGNMKFPELLTTYRKLTGWSQETLADKAKTARSIISNAERGLPLHPDVFNEVKKTFSRSKKLDRSYIELLEEKYDEQLVKMANKQERSSWIADLYVREYKDSPRYK